MRERLHRLGVLLDRRARKSLMVAAAGSVVIALLDAAAVALVLPLVSLVTGETDSRPVAALADLLDTDSIETLTLVMTGMVVALFVLKDVGSMIFSWWNIGFILSERVRVSARTLDVMLGARYTVVAGRNSAELLRTADAAVQQIFNYTVNGLLGLVASGFAILIMLMTLLILAPLPTAGLVLYFAIVSTIFVKQVKPRAQLAGAEMAEASMTGYKAAFAAMGSIKDLALRGSQGHFVDRYRTAQLRGAHAGRVAAFLGGLPKYVLEIVFIFAVALVIVLSTATGQGSTGESVGLIALFVAAGFRLLPSVSAVLGGFGTVRVGDEALQLVHEEYTQLAAERVPVAEGAPTPLRLREGVAVEEVTFRYPGAEESAIDRVSITIPAGHSIALVGGSGAGKSTLADIILGLHEPTSGSIRVDGVDAWARIGDWRDRLSFVPQSVFLLDASIEENVLFDVPSSEGDQQRLQTALASAQLTEFVQSLPSGLQTEVGERGARLSGGQRQRLGIARALYRGGDLLVLDEATSALDNETEHQFNEVLRSLRGSTTVVTIAHRLSTVRQADSIILLERGRVRASGTFDELRKNDLVFANMVQLGSLDAISPSPGSAESVDMTTDAPDSSQPIE